MTERSPSPDSEVAPLWGLVFAAWLIAAASTLGALFFGEVMRLPPCVLCWYQRIAMFPLAIILPLGLFPFDPRVARYALPLAAIGWLLALYHVLIAYGLIPESIQPCSAGVPCGKTVISWFGFITIPNLSLLAFTAIVACLSLVLFRKSR